jgi:hypothetical protein
MRVTPALVAPIVLLLASDAVLAQSDGGSAPSAGPAKEGASSKSQAARDVNAQVNGQIDHPPCGAPGSPGNPLIAITPEVKLCK